jgi:tRNA pseudouridine13 synthase
MKIKVIPEDFRVEEKISLETGQQGKYSIYCLEKRNWSTLDIIDYLKRKYRLSTIRYAGLKDRYAQTFQYVSIIGDGPPKIAEENFSLTYLGKSEHPTARDYLLGNAFKITLRDLKESEIPRINSTLEKIKRDGLPNYFDEQRFGSARHRHGFFTQKLLLKHFNGALKLYMATPSGPDDTQTRSTKKFLADNWGNWDSLKESGFRPKQEFLPVINYLVKHPKDFKGAIRQINRKIFELLIASYQSYLWNEILAGYLQSLNLKLYSYPYSAGVFLFYQNLPASVRDELAALLIPNPSPKTIFKNEKIEKITTDLLSREGFTLKDLKMPIRVRGIFLKPFDRKALVFPEKLSYQEPYPDDRYKNKLKLELSFFLPKGSYATILVKRLQIATRFGSHERIDSTGSEFEEPIEESND